ncbi:hypothetical protein, partial [Burkholderia ubonensis]
ETGSHAQARIKLHGHVWLRSDFTVLVRLKHTSARRRPPEAGRQRPAFFGRSRELLPDSIPGEKRRRNKLLLYGRKPGIYYAPVFSLNLINYPGHIFLSFRLDNPFDFINSAEAAIERNFAINRRSAERDCSPFRSEAALSGLALWGVALPSIRVRFAMAGNRG